MAESDLGKFASGFSSWRRMLASLPRAEMRVKVFDEAAREVAGYVTKGLDPVTAADELQDIATAYGVLELLGQDELQHVISVHLARAERVPEATLLTDDDGGGSSDWMRDDTPVPASYSNGRDFKHTLKAPEIVRHATVYSFPDPRSIPARQWLHGGHYVRGTVTATVAPGGYGKTTLSLYEAITMCANNHRVWYISGEDPRVEIDRRIAAHFQHHNLDHVAVGNRLFIDDPVSFPLKIASVARNLITFNTEALAAFEATIKDNAIDVVILDPFVGFHAVSEVDTNAMDQVIKTLKAIAERTDSCIEVSHHVRKPGAMQVEITIDDARGSSAIVNAVRSGRVLNRMTADNADIARIERDKKSAYLRLDVGKRNLAPAEKADWWHLVSVHLPNGDNVQAIEPWEFPSAFDGMSDADITWVQGLLRASPRRAASQSPEWLGHDLGRRFGRDTTESAGCAWANKIIGQWLANKVFKKVGLRDPVSRKPNVPYYVHNGWDDNQKELLPAPDNQAAPIEQESAPQAPAEDASAPPPQKQKPRLVFRGAAQDGARCDVCGKAGRLTKSDKQGVVSIQIGEDLVSAHWKCAEKQAEE